MLNLIDPAHLSLLARGPMRGAGFHCAIQRDGSNRPGRIAPTA